MGEQPGAAPLGYETEAGWRAGRRGERQEGEASIRSLISLDRTAERVRFLAAMMDARATLQGSSYQLDVPYNTCRNTRASRVRASMVGVHVLVDCTNGRIAR